MDHQGEHTGNVGSRQWTRRALLRTGGASAVGLAVVPGYVSARQITTTAVIPSPERWADENLAGFMIHVGRSQNPVQTREAENCDYENWPPDEISAYDAQLINRKDADTPEETINLHIDTEVDVPPGALFLINTFERCDNGYIGVSLEQIGRRDVAMDSTADAPVADVEDDERPNTEGESTGAIGPGFGALATGAALLVGGLFARFLDE